MEPALGVRVHLRDSRTLDDLCDVTAPPPVEAGDLVGPRPRAVYRVEAVLVPPPGAPVTPVLCRRVELPVAAL